MEIFESREFIYLVMPLFPAGDMYNRLMKKGPYGEEEAKLIIFRLLSAIKYLHRIGIVHRDLKPENILLKRPNDDTDFVVADFGLSKFAAPHEVMNLPCGTITYVAPEVLRGKGYDKTVDIWSTGVICFVLMRGRLPFEGSNKKQIIHKITLSEPTIQGDPKWRNISKHGQDLTRKLLKKDHMQRPTVDQALSHVWFDSVRKTAIIQKTANDSTSSFELPTRTKLNLK